MDKADLKDWNKLATRMLEADLEQMKMLNSQTSIVDYYNNILVPGTWALYNQEYPRKTVLCQKDVKGYVEHFVILPDEVVDAINQDAGHTPDEAKKIVVSTFNWSDT